MTNTETKLSYFKCSDCLTAMTSKENPSVCACGGKLSFMGMVYGAAFGHTEERCACDERCTNAQGPSCDCKCGGENHGTGRVIETVVIDGIVKVKALTEKDTQRADEWRTVKTEMESVITETVNQINRMRTYGELTNWGVYSQLRSMQRKFTRIMSYKVHSKRMSLAHGWIEYAKAFQVGLRVVA